MVSNHLIHVIEVKLDPSAWAWLMCSKNGTHAKWPTNFPESFHDYERRQSEHGNTFKREMEIMREKINAELSGYLVTFQTILRIPLESIEVNYI